MNSQSDGGAKVLVNAYAGSKGAAGGKKKSSIAQSKNAPDSRLSATGSNGRTAGLSRSTSATSTSGGFQSFFRWFRRDDSRVLARSTSGAEVTPELHDRSERQRQQQQPNPQRPQRPMVVQQQQQQQQHDASVGDSLSSGSIGANEESSLVAGGGTIVSRRTIDSTTSSKGSVPTGDGVSQCATSNGTHSSSPSPSPVIDCNNLSKSSSCDSILSTATNGFAFVPPNCYEAVLASEKPENKRTIQPGPYTDSYKRRCWQRDRSRELDRKYELTLRKKYRLFASLRESPSKEQKQNTDTTLTRDNQHTVYSDLSLPATSNDIRSETTNGETQANGVDPSVIRRHRRTVSDSSKDRRAGAYVHVKGKRRAPPPPPLDPGTSGSSSNGTLTRRSNYYGTLSPGSTLSTRKKRPAPAPPVSPTTPYLNEASSSTSLLEDKEIKAIIEGRPLPLLTLKQQPAHESETLIMPLPLLRPLSPLPNISEERAPPGGLTEEQKQQLIDNIRKVQQTAQTTQSAPQTPPTHVNDTCDVMKMEEQFSRANGTRSPIHDYLYAEAMASAKSSSTAQPSSQQAIAAPTSPISPRPWYKRPISGIRQQESSLPFKRDIILKTIDKRKSGTGGSGKHAKETGEDLPEVGYCRNSMLQDGSSSSNGGGSPPSSSGAKFNLFAKITEKSDDTKRRERDAEKRRSAIGIPSISELDREAAEIVHNEYRCNGGAEKDTPSGKQKTTKELISKFEATSVPVVGKVTVNSSFVARKDYFGGDVAQKSVSPATKSPANPSVVCAGSSSDDSPPADVTAHVKPPAPCGPSTSPSPASTQQETTSSCLSKTGSDKNLLGLWNCPYCTLENPNWRIICEACERIKPYDSKLSILEEPPLRPNHPLKRPIPDARKLQSSNSPPVTQATGVDDWDKKTERVLKYFMPKPLAAPATNGTLLVGTSGGDDRASLMQRKPTYGQTKPLASPKMGVKSLMKRVPGDSPMPAPYRNFNVVPERYETAFDNGAGSTNSSNKFDDQKLKESHSNHHTVAAPLASPEPTAEKEEILYAVVNKTSTPTATEQVNIEEIRSARIARFGAIPIEPLDHQPKVECNETEPSAMTKSKEQQDQEALEKEKERLREMIRVMNAKALAEKYPVVQKPPTSNHSSLKRDSPLVQRKNGLTSGIPISTKSLSPLPARKGGSSNPLGTRKSPAPMPPGDHGVKNDATASVVAVIEPVSSPHTGAIRKTFFPRRTSSETGAEGKIINQDGVASTAAIPETVAELNQQQQSGPSLVLTNDVQGIHYEPMDEQQFVRATVGALRQGEPISSIPRPSNVPLSPRLQDRHRKSLLEKQQQHDEKVKQISDQLRSQQGVDRFRNTLLYTSNSNFGRTGTLAINKLLRNLELAISDGAHDRAAELATDLAKMKVSLSVTRQSPGRSTCATSSASLTDISLNVYVDDKVSHKGPLSVSLAAFGTMGQLKQKFCNEYQIPVAVQRWRCDDCPLDDDTKTLFDYGIQTNDRTLHVFLVQPIAPPARDRSKPQTQLQVPGFTKVEAKLLTVSSESEGEHSDTQNDETMLGAAALPIAAPRGTRNAKVEKIAATEEEGWACPMCTLINPQQRPGCAACSEARPNIVLKQPQAEAMPPQDSIIVTPEDLKRFLDEQPPLAPGRRNGTSRELTSARMEVALRNPPLETRNDLNRISSNRKSSDIFNILLDENKASGSGGAVESPVPKPRTSDLVRPVHMHNIPDQNRIVMTAAFQAHRSPNITRSQYRGVDNFNPNSSGMSKPERPIITTASPIVRAVLLKSSTAAAAAGVDKPAAVRFGRNGLALPEDGTEVAPNHYTELVNLDNADLIANIEPFECPICFGPFQPYEGIVLRDCLHSFCKQCLISTIQYSEDAAIRCPYSDAVYSCESVIQQREIKALVSKELYEAHLAKSIQQAESAIDNTFHCRTPNCRGWCIYEDNVNQFKCPVCRIVNCLTCRVIHDGLDCKQYQDRMNSDCDTNLEARRTKAMLQDMIEKGDALNCPTCQVIVMKKWGCDWLKCSMCKTEICWVTRGHRWGPAGKGDTSGGCRCGVNGIKCHPKCNYCH